MASYLFTSRRNPEVCVVTPDPAGETLPAQWGPWDRTDVAWDGQHADLLANIRELLEALVAGDVEDYDEPSAVRH